MLSKNLVRSVGWYMVLSLVFGIFVAGCCDLTEGQEPVTGPVRDAWAKRFEQQTEQAMSKQQQAMQGILSNWQERQRDQRLRDLEDRERRRKEDAELREAERKADVEASEKRFRRFAPLLNLTERFDSLFSKASETLGTGTNALWSLLWFGMVALFVIAILMKLLELLIVKSVGMFGSIVGSVLKAINKTLGLG